MGTVVRLPKPLKIKSRSAQTQKQEPTRDAKILFFSGVRYSRYCERPTNIPTGNQDEAAS